MLEIEKLQSGVVARAVNQWANERSLAHTRTLSSHNKFNKIIPTNGTHNINININQTKTQHTKYHTHSTTKTCQPHRTRQCLVRSWLAGWLADWLVGWLARFRITSSIPNSHIQAMYERLNATDEHKVESLYYDRSSQMYTQCPWMDETIWTEAG